MHNYADLSLDSKMAHDVTAVRKMFSELVQAARQPSRTELDELRQLAQASGQTDPLAHWDVPFWAERLRGKRFGFTDEQLRPYFPLPRVIDGLFSLCTALVRCHLRKSRRTGARLARGRAFLSC
jgi:oligopeptidase A